MSAPTTVPNAWKQRDALRAAGFSDGFVRALEAEISTEARAAVLREVKVDIEGIPAREGFEYADEYQVGWGDFRDAVLAAIDRRLEADDAD